MDLRQMSQAGQQQQPSLQTYAPSTEEPNTAPQPQYAPAATAPTSMVSVQNVKTFMPKLPIRRRISHIYTNAPLHMTREVTRR
jgi:hypothetical protein